MPARDNDSGNGLPASIEAAWGVRERPRKGPKPALSLSQIAAAAVEIATSDGLAAVSMSRVAAECGVSTMSLYRYVSAKDELIMLMIDTAIGAPPAALPPEQGWRAGLAHWAWAARAGFLRHPWAARALTSVPPITPNQVAWLERGLSALRDTGLTEDEKVAVQLLVSGFVRNEAMLAADIAASPVLGQTMASYGAILAKLTDPQRFPAVRAAIAAGLETAH